MGIEKIGLPAKPAAKGSSWVLDASSCQGCQTPFSLFNRKHHCRRCGGLFCGTCSNAKAILRSQGDSPVRVCEPCKKLEEAGRFQLRHRGKPQKGALKGSSVAENDALLKEVLGGHAVDSLLSGVDEFTGGEGDGHHEGSADVSPSKDQLVERKEEETSPEILRDQALDQKRIYTTLKREGRNAEALLAFKRHKELTREADAIELSLKKLAISQRKALAEGIASTDGPVQRSTKDSPDSAKDVGRQTAAQEKVSSTRDLGTGPKSSKDGADDDLLNALKDLGWKEADLAEKKVKKAATSDMELLAEISDSLPKESSTKNPAKQNPTQLEILAHKRQALALKREGKPAEAKEELKQAKLLEKKLEEMALMEDEDEDDDDDELAALMRSLNKETKMGMGNEPRFPSNGGDILPLSFSLAEDDDPNVDVTDDDIHDPNIIAALRSMGWEEEAATMERSRDPKTGGPESFHMAESVTKEANLQSEILTHKRRALALKREGNVAEAKIQLQEAKVLEQKLEAQKSRPTSSQPITSTAAATSNVRGGHKDKAEMRLEDVLEDIDDGAVEVDEDDMRDPEMMAALKAMGFEEEDPLPALKAVVKPSPLEKKNLQNEILAGKRSALALKRQGKTLEAREELRQAKALEQKLEKMQKDLEANCLPSVANVAGKSHREAQIPLPSLIAAGVVSEDEEEEVEVNADDFMDPDLVAALKSVGWQEEDTFVKDKEPEKEEETAASPMPAQQPYKAVKLAPKDHARKLQLQKELLAHKRKALALKREGKAEEAKAELARGKILENEMEEIDNAASGVGKDPEPKKSCPALPAPLDDDSGEEEEVTDEDMHDPELLNALKAFGWKPEPEKVPVVKAESALPVPSKVEKAKLDVTNPPYKKGVPEPEPFVDPIWHAIMKSASINHNEAADTAMEQTTREDSLLGDHSFEGKRGEMSSSRDSRFPLFDHPSSVPDPPKAVSGQMPSFDLLSGGAWDAAPAGNALEKLDSEEDDDDIFDSGLLAALQSIGLGTPSKPGSSVQSQGDAPKAKRQGHNQQIQKTMSAESGRWQQNDSVPHQATSAAPVESSAPSRPGRVELAGKRLPDPPQPAMSVSRDRDTASPNSNNYASAADAGGGTAPSLEEEIKMHKRKALTLKREGKTIEAREELRQAKVLEKQLEAGAHSASTQAHQSPDGVSKTGGAVSSTASNGSQTVSPEKSSQAHTHKEQVRQELRQGKDRKKLQQESLAHKRKALGLRREGKTAEADAEFELAKALEKQMDGLDQQMGKVSAQEDMGMVEDLLDPQLMAALKGLGFNDGELHGGASVNRVSPPSVNKNNQQSNPQAGKSVTTRPLHTNPTNAEQKNAIETSHESQSREGRSTSAAAPANRVKDERTPNRTSQITQPTGGRSKEVWGKSSGGGSVSSSASASQTARKQLEDKIRREKLKALELKRAGRQGGALEILRGAKRLEKELLAMPS